jgi:hypothetical protein
MSTDNRKADAGRVHFFWEQGRNFLGEGYFPLGRTASGRGEELWVSGRPFPYFWDPDNSHTSNNIPKRPINPANSQVLGRWNPQAAATSPTIKARTTGTRGLFTLVPGLAPSSGGLLSSAGGLSDMKLHPFRFKEIIPKSDVIIFLLKQRG